MVKNPPANAGDVRDVGWIPGLGKFPGEGKGYPLQYSCLKNPHGQRSLVGYRPQSLKESDTTKAIQHAQHTVKSLLREIYLVFCDNRTSLVQWLRPRALNAGGLGSISGWGTTSHMS